MKVNTWFRLSVVCALMLLAVVLRFHAMEERSLWEDEGDSYLGSQGSAAWTVTFLLSNGVHPPLYYYIQKVSFPLGGSEFALRLPAAVFGVLGTASVLRLGRERFGWAAGLLAGLLMAASPFAVMYGRDARMYSLVVLLTLGVVRGLWQLLTGEQPRLWNWLAYVLLSASLYFTHYFSLILPASQFMFLLLTFHHNYKHLRLWAAAQALAAIPVTLWLIRLFNFGAYFKIAWIQPVPWYAPLRTLAVFTAGEGNQLWQWMVAVGVGVIAAIGILTLWRMRPQRDRALFILLWLVFPPVFTLVVSLKRPVYVDRYLIGSLPALILALAVGILALWRWRRWAAVAVVVTLAGVMVRQSLTLFDWHSATISAREDWRAASDYIKTHERAGDVLLLRSIFYFPFAYYYRGPSRVLYMDADWQLAAPEELSGRRLWVVFRGAIGANDTRIQMPSTPNFEAETDDSIRGWLQDMVDYLVEIRLFDGVTVLLFEIPDSQAAGQMLPLR